MIVQIQPKELPRMYPCAASFFAASGIPGQIDLPRWTQQWESFLSGGSGVMFAQMDGEDAVGVIAGLLHPQLETGDLWLTEIYWFILPDHRGGSGSLRLFDAFEKWGAEHGAKVITMGNMEHLTPGPLSKLYFRRGYRPLETHWLKEVV